MKNYSIIVLLALLISDSIGSQTVKSELIGSIGKERFEQAIPMHGTNKSDQRGLLKFSSTGLLKLPSSSSVSLAKAKKEKITFTTWSTYEALNPGDDFVVVTKINLDDGWHIYGDGETTGLITNLELISGEFTELENGLSPSVEKKMNLGSKLLVSYYLTDGSFVWIRLRLRKDLVLGKNIKLKLRLNYQLCSDSVCLLPSNKDLIVPIEVGRSKKNFAPKQFQKAEVLFKSTKFSNKVESSYPDNSTSDLEKIIGENSVLALLLAFIWGLLASLTPCVYPMIPITVSLFASDQKNETRTRRLFSACFYVAGITLVYASLGVITSYTGRDLGSWLAEPIVVIPLSLLMILLACSMFGLFEIDLPNSIKMRLSNIEGRSPITLFFMGAAMGFVAAPCVGPFAGSIILWLAKNPGSPIFGFLLMSAFGLGMGCLFLFIAVFSQSFLPRSGVWMVSLKQTMGYVLIGMSYYFISVLIPEDKVIVGWALYLMIAGGLMGAFAQLEWDAIWWRHLLKTCGVILFLIGCFQCLVFLVPDSDIRMSRNKVETKSLIHTDFDSAFKEAKKSEKPLFLYFGARWCIPCKKIKEVVLKDESVKKLLTNFVVAHLDCTKSSSKAAKIKENRFNSHSMPFFAFFDSRGKHLKPLDIHGAVEVGDLLDHLSKVD